MIAKIPDALLNSPVRQVRRVPAGAQADGGGGGAMVITDHGAEHFDDVVLAWPQ